MECGFRIPERLLKPRQPANLPSPKRQTDTPGLHVPFLAMLLIHLSSSSISISITEGVSSSKIGLDGGQKHTFKKKKRTSPAD